MYSLLTLEQSKQNIPPYIFKLYISFHVIDFLQYIIKSSLFYQTVIVMGLLKSNPRHLAFVF